ncbi:MAG: universal stress protein [Opitutales bacterium]
MKRILVCVDGSPYAEPVCQLATWWACSIDAGVHVIYISDLRQFEIPVCADLSGSLGVQPYQGVTAHMQKIEKDKAGVLEQTCRGYFDQAGMDPDRVTFEHSTGFLVDTIEKIQSEYLGIVIGKRGENADYAKGHLGSMMERIVRNATVPVCISARQYNACDNVLLAFDGSEHARKALDFVASGSMFAKCTVSVVSVAEDRDAEQYAETLREAESKIENLSTEVSFQLLGGEPEDTIAAFVEENEIDLMIMGAYGHSRIRNFFIGSTTSEMIRRCKIPIMCFR